MVELLLHQAGGGVRVVVTDRAGLREQRRRHAQFLVRAPGRRRERRLARVRVTAAGVGPHTGGVVLAERPLLEQQPAVLVEEEHRERAVQLSRRLMGGELLRRTGRHTLLVDQFQQNRLCGALRRAVRRGGRCDRHTHPSPRSSHPKSAVRIRHSRHVRTSARGAAAGAGPGRSSCPAPAAGNRPGVRRTAVRTVSGTAALRAPRARPAPVGRCSAPRRSGRPGSPAVRAVSSRARWRSAPPS